MFLTDSASRIFKKRRFITILFSPDLTIYSSCDYRGTEPISQSALVLKLARLLSKR